MPFLPRSLVMLSIIDTKGLTTTMIAVFSDSLLDLAFLTMSNTNDSKAKLRLYRNSSVILRSSPCLPGSAWWQLPALPLNGHTRSSCPEIWCQLIKLIDLFDEWKICMGKCRRSTSYFSRTRSQFCSNRLVYFSLLAIQRCNSWRNW